MELNHRAYKASKFAQDDVISSLPDNVLTNIMDRLPLQDAVRTSILSRSSRFKWTMLSQLVFDDKFFKYLKVTKREENHGGIISRLLLHLNGTVTKFVLSIGRYSCSISDEDISHWILFLSQKRLQDLTLRKKNGPPHELLPNGTPLKLPTHLFCCLELKHLKLYGCSFDPPVTFDGFPNLLSLELDMVRYESGKFEQFISWCPALEVLKMGLALPLIALFTVDFSKLANLKTLSLQLCNLSDMKFPSSDIIFKLVDFFPKLEELDLDFCFCKLREGDDAMQTLPTTFPCLKALRLSRVDLGDVIMLSFVSEMIRRSPNLHTLQIRARRRGAIAIQQAVNYKTVGLLQLRNVVLNNASENKNEVGLIEYLLASSPFLRKIAIYPYLNRSPADKFLFAKKLLELPRASPTAKVYINWGPITV